MKEGKMYKKGLAIGLSIGLLVLPANVFMAGCIPTKISQEILSVSDDVLLALQSLTNAYSMFCDASNSSESKLCALNNAKYDKLVGEVIAAINIFNAAVKAGTVGASKDQMQLAYDQLFSFLEEIGVIRTITEVQSEKTAKLNTYSVNGNVGWKAIPVQHKRF